MLADLLIKGLPFKVFYQHVLNIGILPFGILSTCALNLFLTQNSDVKLYEKIEFKKNLLHCSTLYYTSMN